VPRRPGLPDDLVTSDPAPNGCKCRTREWIEIDGGLVQSCVDCHTVHQVKVRGPY